MGTFKRKLLIFAQNKWEKDEFLHVFACVAGLEEIVFVKLYGFLYSSGEKGVFDLKEPERGKKDCEKNNSFCFFAKKSFLPLRQKAFGNCNQDFCFWEMYVIRGKMVRANKCSATLAAVKL